MVRRILCLLLICSAVMQTGCISRPQPQQTRRFTRRESAKRHVRVAEHQMYPETQDANVLLSDVPF